MNIVSYNAVVEHLFDSHVVSIGGMDRVDARKRMRGDAARFEHVDVRTGIGHDAVGRLPEVSPDPELVRLRGAKPVSDPE